MSRRLQILIVSPYLPVPANSGSAIRLQHIVRGLAETETVDLVGLDMAGPSSSQEYAALDSVCRDLVAVSWRKVPKWRQIAGIARRLTRWEPIMTKYVESTALAEKVRAMTAQRQYDIIAFEQTVAAVYRDAVSFGQQARTVLSTHDIAFLQFRRMVAQAPWGLGKLILLLSWLPLRSWEPRMVRRCDCTLTVSEADKQVLLARAPGLNVEVVENGVDTKVHTPLSKPTRPQTMLLVGSMVYHPNIDAACFFSEEVFPLIRARCPDAQLMIVGKSPPPRVCQLDEASGIEVHGDVADVVPFYEQATLSLAPLRAGGGTRLKILESMALGRPVVATTTGAEGLRVSDGTHLLIADSAVALADACARLLSEPASCSTIAAAARELVEREYDWSSIASRLRRLYRDLAAE